MRNYIQPGDIVVVNAPETTTAGDGTLVGNLFGIAVTDAANGAPVQIKTTGVFSLPKVTTQEWTVGAVIYWDDGNDRCTTVDTNVAIGVALAVTANPSATGIVRLHGGVWGTVVSA
jgi:predicted RecA/RadA family phage recombinase